MNSECELCREPDDMLVQHPTLDLMVCITCYQDALEALHDDIREGGDEVA